MAGSSSASPGLANIFLVRLHGRMLPGSQSMYKSPLSVRSKLCKAQQANKMFSTLAKSWKVMVVKNKWLVRIPKACPTTLWAHNSLLLKVCCSSDQMQSGYGFRIYYFKGKVSSATMQYGAIWSEQVYVLSIQSTETMWKIPPIQKSICYLHPLLHRFWALSN